MRTLGLSLKPIVIRLWLANKILSLLAKKVWGYDETMHAWPYWRDPVTPGQRTCM
jgi:hypothetical protein